MKNKPFADADVEWAYRVINYAIHGKEKDKVFSNYKRSIAYFSGDHEIRKRNDKDGNRVYNKYAEVFENRTAHLTDSLPKWHFSPQDGSNDIFTADALNQIIGDVIWDDIKWEEQGEVSVDEAAHAGSSHIKTNVNKSNGYPTYTVVPCGQALPDPIATNKKEMRFFIHAFPMAVKSIKRDYKEEVKPERFLDINADMTTDMVQKSFENTNDTAPSDSFESGLRDSKGLPIADPGKIGQALVFEIHYDDDTLEKIPFDVDRAEQILQALVLSPVPVDPEDNHVEAIKFFEEALKETDELAEPNFVRNLVDHIQVHYEYPLVEKRKKYPRGCVLTVCQGKKLSKEANPLPIDWKDIFIKWNFFNNPGKWWGKGLGIDLFDPQDTVNHRFNSITQNINNLNNGVVLIRSGVIQLFNKLRDNLTKLNNKWGKVIPVSDTARDYRRDFGPELPAAYFNELSLQLGFMEAKSGHEGITAGRYPAGSPAGVTVDQLLNEAQKPINSVVKRYSRALAQMARNSIAIMNEFMPDNEKFTIINDENVIQNVEWGALKDRAGLLNIRVDVIGNMASTRQRKFAEAVQLRNIGVYDNEAVLESIDDPKKFAVMQRMSQIQELMGAVQYLKEQNDVKDKQINTLMNRQQKEGGDGNIGTQQSVREKAKA